MTGLMIDPREPHDKDYHELAAYLDGRLEEFELQEANRQLQEASAEQEGLIFA